AALRRFRFFDCFSDDGGHDVFAVDGQERDLVTNPDDVTRGGRRRSSRAPGECHSLEVESCAGLVVAWRSAARRRRAGCSSGQWGRRVYRGDASCVFRRAIIAAPLFLLLFALEAEPARPSPAVDGAITGPSGQAS